MKKVYIVTLCIDNSSEGIKNEIIGAYSTFRKAYYASGKKQIEANKSMASLENSWPLGFEAAYSQIKNNGCVDLNTNNNVCFYVEIEEHELK